MEFAARQRRFEHIARIHRAFGLARAHHGVHLVDEDDGLPFIHGQFLQHGFQALLELAAELGTGNQGGHVQRQHALAFQRFGHFAVDDALRQAFDDGRLAHARFADQHGVVLAAALQDLDGAADFIVAADHRVELALACAFRHVQGVFFQGFALAFGLLRIDLVAAAHGVDGRFQGLAGQAVFARQLAAVGLVFRHGQQDHFAGHELVARLLRFLVGQVQQGHEFAADLHVAARARHLRQAFDRSAQGLGQAAHVDAGPLQERAGAAVVLVQQGRQQVDWFDIGIVVAHGQTLCVGQGFL